MTSTSVPMVHALHMCIHRVARNNIVWECGVQQEGPTNWKTFRNGTGPGWKSQNLGRALGIVLFIEQRFWKCGLFREKAKGGICLLCSRITSEEIH